MTTAPADPSTERRIAYANALRVSGAIRTDRVHAAFATVPRHRFVPHFRYGPEDYRLDLTQDPPAEALDLIYANNALLTCAGTDTDPPSSSSGPSVMAKMLEALDLRPGLRVLEIGAGTGYNAALIHHLTAAPVVTVDAGRQAADEAAAALRGLGLDAVDVVRGDGYVGHPDAAPYDRIIATCGIAGIPSAWLDQLSDDALVVAPVAHAGVHPIITADYDSTADALSGRALLWGDFMPAVGSLRPAGLFHHDPARDIPATDARRISDAGPVLDQAQYQDLWCYLGVHDGRITRATPDVDAFALTTGTCALVDPFDGAAWIHTDGTLTLAGVPALGGHLSDLVQQWEAAGRPAVTEWTIHWQPAPGTGLLTPQWRDPSASA